MAERLIAVPAARSHIDAVVADPILKACMHSVLDSLPAVDAVEVVHGEWLDGYATQNGKVVYKSIDCSVCEEYFKIESYDREYWKARFKVCPFCGAKMDLEVPDGQA